jgi:hypothetical protein
MPIVFKGRVFAVEVETRRHPNGREHEMAIVRHRPSVVLIPVDDDGRVILVRQMKTRTSKRERCRLTRRGPWPVAATWST